MKNREVTTTIDPDKCSGCQLCIKVCPSETLSIIEGVAVVTGDASLSCGHCMAICPEGAIQVHGIDENSTQFKTFDLNKKWLGYNKFPISDLARLITSKRSCRNFKQKSVEQEILRDLIKLSTFAPSGTNSQKWTFTCLTTREKVVFFSTLIGKFFKALNKKAESKFLRTFLKMVGNSKLESYYSEYYEKVKQTINDMENNGIDRLFHGATACIIIGSAPGSSCPKEDAILAAGNILLATHAIGLGTCMIGFAHEAMKNDPSIAKALNIPKHEKIHAVIAIGYPDEKYKTITGRKKPAMTFLL